MFLRQKIFLFSYFQIGIVFCFAISKVSNPYLICQRKDKETSVFFLPVCKMNKTFSLIIRLQSEFLKDNRE